MTKHLHIISLTVPYPVDYGGVVDIFYKLEALHRSGVNIHLHCFSKSKNQPAELLRYCSEVNYYPRKKGPAGLSLSLPYIVSSRVNESLMKRLLEDDYPVLIEGIHCAALLTDPRFSQRKIFLRLHNVEHLYYRALLHTSSSLLKKAYYLFESVLLKKFERKIASKPALTLTVSKEDEETYRRLFNVQQVEWLPVFTGFKTVNIKEGRSAYCLYHGNLSVAENERAVTWLLENVFHHIDIPLVIAGYQPGKKLVSLVNKYKGVKLIANPDNETLQRLIAEAQCHVLPSMNYTGVKLKLINALFNGRHCIVNTSAVRGSALEPLCIIANTNNQFQEAIKKYFAIEFSKKEIEMRSSLLLSIFDNDKNCRQLNQWLW